MSVGGDQTGIESRSRCKSVEGIDLLSMERKEKTLMEWGIV